MYDVAVIGGGPAGLSAAVQVRARGKSVVVIGGDARDNALYRTSRIDNFLGFPGVTGPELLVADEPVTSLDVTVQAQIIALFCRLQEEAGFSMLFIAHDLALVSSFCDRVGVMYRGKLVETAAAAELFGDPRHPYTRSLLAAVPLPDPRRARARKFVPYRPQEGENEGPLTEVAPGHFVRKGARG